MMRGSVRAGCYGQISYNLETDREPPPDLRPSTIYIGKTADTPQFWDVNRLTIPSNRPPPHQRCSE